MKIVDLHPDDLLDKELRGTLTDAERARLDAHLARCATCTFEREARADFAAELDDEEAVSLQRVLALVETKHVAREEPIAKAPDETVAEPKEEPTVETKAAPVTTRRGRRTARIVLLAAAALLVGGVATARGGPGVWARLTSVWSDATVSETSHDPPAEPVMAAKAVTPARSPMPSVEPIVSPPPAISVEPAELPHAPAAVVVAPPSPPIESAASLFEAASEARRVGDYTRAITLHQRLQSSFPTSREAHTSQATVGRLLLDRGDPALALASFDAYQTRGHGPLDEPVLVGRATALERLGRTSEARAAWKALLAAFPETPYAEHARSRIEGTSLP